MDHVICYQSRATPQKWIEPSTEREIERAAQDKVAVLVVPIAFVSEHSETLVELDVEYRDMAEKQGVPGYFRVPTQNADPGVHRRAGRHRCAARLTAALVFAARPAAASAAPNTAGARSGHPLRAAKPSAGQTAWASVSWPPGSIQPMCPSFRRYTTLRIPLALLRNIITA